MFACCSVTCVDEILVGEAGVVHVVHGAGEDGGEGLEGGEHGLQRGRAQQRVHGQRHVRGVRAVVIWHFLQTEVRNIFIPPCVTFK